jgi:hypothetical protein
MNKLADDKDYDASVIETLPDVKKVSVVNSIDNIENIPMSADCTK